MALRIPKMFVSKGNKNSRSTLVFGKFLPWIFVSVVLVAAVVGTWVLIQTYRAQSISRDISSTNIPTLIQIQNIQVSIQQLNSALMKYQLSLRPDDGRSIKGIIAETTKLVDTLESQGSGLKEAHAKMKGLIAKLEQSFEAMDQAISDMHDCRTTLRETEETFGVYLEETISSQLSKSKASSNPASNIEALKILNSLNVSSQKIARMSSDAYSQRKPELIQSGQEICQSMQSNIVQAASYGRVGVQARDSRGLAIKDEFAKLEAQVVVFNANLNLFHTAWNEMEKHFEVVKQAALQLAEASESVQNATKEKARHSSTSSANELLGLSVMVFLTLVLGIVALVVLGVYFVKAIANPLRNQGRNLIEKSASSLSHSQKMKEVGKQLSQQCNHQAETLESMVGIIKGVEDLATQTANFSFQAASLSKDGRTKAEAGTEALNDVLESMNAIEEAIKKLVQAVREIKESDSRVADITKQIDKIARQTNLLAINAAVEAAHAGEAGLGFAVVAEEVKNLSKSVTEAARKTSDCIQTSIVRCDLGVRCSNDVSESLMGVIHSTEVMRDRLLHIIEHSKGVEGSVQEIHQAVDRQKNAVHQVSNSLSEIQENTKSTAETAIHTANAAEIMERDATDISTVAREIHDLTSVYDGQLIQGKIALPLLPKENRTGDQNGGTLLPNETNGRGEGMKNHIPILRRSARKEGSPF